ncbi:MAG TPA: hypothetical protein VK761_05305 [Solirubrobacteraceae bacterium]|jgi:hypothetical protein|nr:hypothetical protein [Solirubrobacteraceae bacterium]
MSVSEGSPIERIARARVVADAPVEGLLERVDELARRWVIAQLSSRPLQQMAEVPLAQLAADAPELCESLVRALASDAELARLLGGEQGSAREGSPQASASRALALGASDAGAIAASVESLRSVVWRQTLAELRDPSAALVADLADRLAFVCAALLSTTLAAQAGERGGAVARPAGGASSSAPHGRSGSSHAARRGGAVLIDELDDLPRPLTAESARTEARVAPSAGAGRDAVAHGARPWDTPLRGGSSVSPPAAADATTSEHGVAREDEPQLRVRRASSVPVDELR